MFSLKLCHKIIIRFLVTLVIISSFVIPPAFSQESEDSQVFIAGFNAYQQKNYAEAIEKMNEVLQKFPDTPLRDMALFWLSRSYFKAGNQQEAARYLSKFSKEYPNNPLKGTVEEELLILTARYEKGEKLPTGAPLVSLPDRLAAQKAKVAQERLAAEAKLAIEKKEQERIAGEVVAAEKSRLAIAERERMAAGKAEEARLAAEANSEAARLAALKQSEEKSASEIKERERLATVKAGLERNAAEKVDEARRTAVKKEQERLASKKVEEDRLAAVAASEAERANAIKRAEEKAAADKKDIERLATIKVKEDQLLAAQQAIDDKVISQKQMLREKAIAQYKSIIDKYPGSPAAKSAAAKLRDLGLAVALPPVAAAEQLPENTQVLKLEVAQYASFEFNLPVHPEAFHVAQQVTIPFEITNRGNGNDSFSLESSFPSEFKVHFAAASAPDKVINQTPELAQGETYRGVISLVVPAASIDGLRIIYPVKALSRLMAVASQSREIRLIASSPLLRAVLKSDKTRPLPGEKVLYRVAVLNVGSTAAEDVTLRLIFPPQLDPLDYAEAGFKQENKSAILLDGLKVKSGESHELNVAFQLKDDSLAGQELVVRAELVNNQVKTTAAFVSNISSVQSQRGVNVRPGTERLVAIPGQTINVPFVITNVGNVREKFIITSSVKGAQNAIVFHDLNRDGIRQASEPIISEIGPLAPKEEASVVIELKTPKTAADGTEGSVLLSLGSEGDPARSASGTTRFLYSRPVLQMAMSKHDGRLKPGEIASFDLTISNQGSNLAKVVELQSTWPERLEFVAAEPANSSFSNGNITWRFNEMGASEKRNIKVSFRVKQGTGAGTNIQVKNILTYEDQIGNRY